MSAPTVASAAADLRDLIMAAGTTIAEKDSLLQAATRLEAAAECGECPRCAGRESADVTALRRLIRPYLGTGEQLHHEKAGEIARAIAAGGWARS